MHRHRRRRRIVGTISTGVFRRVDAADDPVTVVELRARIAGLVRLRRATMGEIAMLRAEFDGLPAGAERSETAQELRALHGVAAGAREFADELQRLLPAVERCSRQFVPELDEAG